MYISLSDLSQNTFCPAATTRIHLALNPSFLNFSICTNHLTLTDFCSFTDTVIVIHMNTFIIVKYTLSKFIILVQKHVVKLKSIS